MLQTPVSLCLGMPCPLPPIQEAAESSSSQGEEEEEEAASPLLQIGSCSGYTEMRIKLKQNEAFPGPKVSQTHTCNLLKAVSHLHPRDLGVLFKSWKQGKEGTEARDLLALFSVTGLCVKRTHSTLGWVSFLDAGAKFPRPWDSSQRWVLEQGASPLPHFQFS